MAIVLRSVATQGNAAASPTITVPKPAGVVSGDVLVANIAVRGGGNTITLPTGWNTLVEITGNTTVKTFVSYKVAGGSEPVDYTWTLSASVASSGGIAAYSGVNNSTPIDVPANSAFSTVAVHSITVSGITTLTNNSMVIGGTGLDSATYGTTPPTGMTEQWDFVTGCSNQFSDMAQAVKGATGDKTWTITNVGIDRIMSAWLSALRDVNESPIALPAPATASGGVDLGIIPAEIIAT